MGGELRFVCSGTSPLGHLYSRVDSLQGSKNLALGKFSHNLCIRYLY